LNIEKAKKKTKVAQASSGQAVVTAAAGTSRV
jgi:hypothetical protein